MPDISGVLPLNYRPVLRWLRPTINPLERTLTVKLQTWKSDGQRALRLQSPATPCSISPVTAVDWNQHNGCNPAHNHSDTHIMEYGLRDSISLELSPLQCGNSGVRTRSAYARDALSNCIAPACSGQVKTGRFTRSTP